jgi:DNA-binding response OmpR family regulator
VARILLVEDDKATRDVMSLALERGGYSVRGVPSAEEAFAASPARFDLVLMDIGLPGLSGVEACRRLKVGTPRTPVILVTMLGRSKDKVEGLDAGADDYVVKPVQPAVLLARVDALLRRYKKSV